MNFVIYFILTCGLPIWLGFFSYKDVVVAFVNFLVLQEYLMGNNIVSMCGMASILRWNPYGVWKQLFYPYYSRNLLLNKFPSQLRILCKQENLRGGNFRFDSLSIYGTSKGEKK
jgi:hypothetical protein